MDQLNTVTKNIDSSMQKLTLANLTLENIKTKTLTLKYTADNLKQNSTKLQERNVEGKILKKDLINICHYFHNTIFNYKIFIQNSMFIVKI